MLKVGLTGGIGSGKTTVAKIFTSLGVPVYFADIEARNLMQNSESLIQLIKNNFGEETYLGNELNRKFLAEIVFKNEAKLRKLNQIIHPAVHRHFEEWIAKQQETDYLVEEAALLYETGAWKFFDYTMLVIAPIDKRIERVMKRDGVGEEEVQNRILAQLPDEEKIPNSNFIIFNDDQNMVLNQVLAFHEKMISLNKK